MNPRRVGSRPVSPVGLGGARWSLAEIVDEELARATVHAALAAGVTLFDTALAYTTATRAPAGHNEELLGAALAAHPLGAVATVVTKGGHYRDPAGGFPIDGRPATLREHCRRSVAALGRVDLYLLHWPDPAVPLADSVGELARLRDEGVVGLIGVSNVTADQLAQALAVTTLDAVENRYSPHHRDDEVLRRCEAEGIAYLAYSPFGGRSGAPALATGAFADVAGRRGVTPQEVVVAWLLTRSPVLVPIVGAGRPASIESAVRGAALTLEPADVSVLNGEV